MNLNYPIKFKPILKEKIWGGNKLSALLHKDTDKSNIGESWEISNVKDNVSVVTNGKLKGHTLNDLMVLYRDAFLGEKVFSKFSYEFPLLIKFIDAKEALSIQLHPNDDLARERHDSFGKTEMWYIMQADDEGKLIVGFKKNSNKFEYLKHLKDKTLLDILNVDEVKKGDVYFIPTGRIHAIGAGVLLAEIQQTSDITYRIYDWDRQDASGNYRELHTEQALEAIDYNAEISYTTNYDKTLNRQSKIVDCQYFTTNIFPINGSQKVNHSDKDSFVIYMCVEGTVHIESPDTEKVTLNFGETVLIPAALKEIEMISDGKSELLEVYIK